MQSLSLREVKERVEALGFVWSRWGTPEFRPPYYRVQRDFPDTPERIPVHLRFHLEWLQGLKECSTLFWVFETGVYDQFADEIGKRAIELMRSEGQPHLLSDRPGTLFARSEWRECVAAAVIAVVSGWDAFLIPEHGRAYLSIRHDEFLEVFSPERDFAHNEIRWLAELGVEAKLLTVDGPALSGGFPRPAGPEASGS